MGCKLIVAGDMLGGRDTEPGSSWERNWAKLPRAWPGGPAHCYPYEALR